MATLKRVNKPDYNASTNPESFQYLFTTEGDYKIDVREDPMGYGESHGPQGTEYRRVLGVRWDQSVQFLQDLLGTVTIKDGLGNLRRTPPEQMPGFPDFYCLSAEFLRASAPADIDPDTTLVQFSQSLAGSEGSGGAGGSGAAVPPFVPGSTAGDGIVWYSTVWRKPLYDILTDSELKDSGGTEVNRYVYKKPTYAGDTIPLPGQTFKFVNQPSTPPGVPVGTEAGARGWPLMSTVSINNLWTEWTYTWTKVPLVPRTAVDTCRGKVNSSSFDNREAQTMLFAGFEQSDPYSDVEGYTYYDLAYKFIEVKRSNINTAVAAYTKGHNLYFRPSASKWEDFSIDGTMSKADGNRQFDQADLNTLFLCVA